MSDEGGRAPDPRAGARDRVLAVRSVGLFAGLDDEGATLLSEYSKLTSFKAGQRVTRAADPVQGVFVLIDGRVDVIRPNGEPFILEGGRAVNLLGALMRTNGAFESVARAPTRTLEIPADAFLAAMEENFSLQRSVLRVLASAVLDVQGDMPRPGGAAAAALEGGAMTLTRRVLQVSQTGIFVDANVDAVFDVARIVRDLEARAGDVVWRAGEPARRFVRWSEGRMRCVAPDGREIRLDGDYVLGTIAALAGRDHAYDLVVEEPVRGFVGDFEDLLLVLESHPELGVSLAGVLAEMLARLL